jgi:hypothetical protein
MEVGPEIANIYLDTRFWPQAENMTLVFVDPTGEESFVELDGFTNDAEGTYTFSGEAVLECQALIEQVFDAVMLSYETVTGEGREAVIAPLFVFSY